MHDDSLNDDQLLRYSRQIMLPDFGYEAQEKLRDAHIGILGLGGLGSPASIYLCAAGVGRLSLVDFDAVELSNLQRQVVHGQDRLALNKAVSAGKTLSTLNPDTRLDIIERKLDDAELAQLFNELDCVIDATDNFASRFAINRACITTGTPLVSAAAIRYEGQLSVFDTREQDSACYACLYPEQGQEETGCNETGILGPVVGTMGCMQALEAIKLITGTGSTAINRLLLFDALALEWRSMKIGRDPDCPACKNRPAKAAPL